MVASTTSRMTLKPAWGGARRRRFLWSLLLAKLFRLHPLGLEYVPGRLIAANRYAPWDWLFLPSFLGPGSWIILPAADCPPGWVVRLFGWVHFVPQEQVDEGSLVRHVVEGHTVVYFPEPLSPASGCLRKVTVSYNVSCPRSVLALEGTQYWRLMSVAVGGKGSWFPAITLSVHPLETKGSGLELQEGLGRAKLAAQFMGKTLWGALVLAAQRHGRGRVVLDDEQGQRLSYGRLMMKSIILSQLIRPRLGTDTRIGVLLPTTVAAVVTVFAVHLCRRVPAMLNFSAGPNAILAACGTARISVVLTSRLFVQKAGLQQLTAALTGIEIVYLEDRRSQMSMGILFRSWWRWRCPQRDGWTPDDAAVVLFTSGSEGTPKGVVLSHQNLLANVTQVLFRVHLGYNDCILNVLPMFHAFGLTVATLAPLLAGARVFCYPSVLDYRAVPRMAWTIGATILAGTDTFLRGYGRMADPGDFQTLRYCFSGAEPLRVVTRRLWMEKFGIRILEGYGATETSPVLAVNTPEGYREGSVGRMLPGIGWRLISVPGGVDGGVLQVRGPNVMMGYLRASDPGVIQPPAVGDERDWYDTGDVIRMDADGFVWIQGRVKRFAKVGGEMVSLAAVETIAAEEWPDSLHGVVAVDDPQKGEALVLVTEDRRIHRQIFAKVLKERGLSPLMLPAWFVYCDSMPLLASGKLDWEQLGRLVRKGEE
ncbi:MAG: AMP-binding protein [Magnetococcales bacterium]|nr:AMP-binding protein [Magnetococcales bacterium]